MKKFLLLFLFSLKSFAQEVVIIDDFSYTNSHGYKVEKVFKKHTQVNILKLSAFDYIKSLKQVLEIKPLVLNLSFGSKEYDSEEVELLKKISNDGTWIVVAAGNDNSKISMSNPIYPCFYKIPNLVCIGAYDKNNKAVLSNFGPSVKYFASGHFQGQNLTSFAAPKVSSLIFQALKCQLDPISILNQGKGITVSGYHQTLLDELSVKDFCYTPLAHSPF